MFVTRKHTYIICIAMAMVYTKCSCIEENSTSSIDPDYSKIQKENLMIFHDLDSVLQVFNSKEHCDLEETRNVINDFNHLCLGYRKNVPQFQISKQPFIVIEGNHRTSRKIVARRLAKRIGGSFLQNPPNCIITHRSNFAYGSVLRRAYFGLSVYAAAQVAARIINKWPVVLNGYWMDQTAFTISRAFADHNLPPKDSNMYKWPYDLLKPDLIFYVNFPENLHDKNFTTRVPYTWRLRVKEVYDNMRDDSFFEISTAAGFENVITEIERIITDRLSDKFEITFTERSPSRKKYPHF